MNSMTNAADLKAGDKIKAITAPGLTETAIADLGLGTYVRHSSVAPRHIICDFDKWGEMVVTGWELVECADATPTEQRDNEIERLQTLIRDLSDDVVRNGVLISNLKQALSIVNERLNAEADKRDWCSEYDEILREVNYKIERDAGGVYHLQGLRREWKFSVQGTATVDWEEEVTVEASTEDEARSLLESDPSSYFDEYEAIDNHVRNWGYTDQNITDIDLV